MRKVEGWISVVVGAVMEKSDARLVEEVLGGEVGSYEELVRRYMGLARSLAYSVVRDFHLAEDVVQRSFLKAYRVLDQLEDGSRFKGWLMEIVRTTSLDVYREVYRRGLGKLEVDLVEEWGGGEVPEEVVLRHELQELVRRVLFQMPLVYREVLVLKHMEGLSYREMAELLGTSVSAIESRLFRARRMMHSKLRGMLKEFSMDFEEGIDGR